MRLYSSDALILRTYRYGEADRIVVFLTEDRGKRRGVAKNATNSRRRFGAGLEPLTRGRVTYVEREHRELVRLDRIEPTSTPLVAVAMRATADAAHALGHASYFAELLDEWAPEAQPNERLFRLGAAMGDAFARAGSIEALARYFEFWLLRLEGVYPALDRCPRCGRASFDRGAVLVAADRTFVCADCSEGGTRLTPAAVAFLRQALRRTPADVIGAAVPQPVLREVGRAHERLIALHLEKTLRSARVVQELSPEP
jgi:DNA repair protein RecO (recombination protein O)